VWLRVSGVEVKGCRFWLGSGRLKLGGLTNDDEACRLIIHYQNIFPGKYPGFNPASTHLTVNIYFQVNISF
jgi:hypothetical protein